MLGLSSTFTLVTEIAVMVAAGAGGELELGASSFRLGSAAPAASQLTAW